MKSSQSVSVMTDINRKPIDYNNFYSWTKDHQYKSSYFQTQSNTPVPLKNGVIPGYQGYLPYFISENKHGNTFCNIAKQCLNDKKLGENVNKLSTNGHNYRRHDFQDVSITANTHKYGSNTQQNPHPVLHASLTNSNYQDKFINPKDQVSPTQTEKTMPTNVMKTNLSGFLRNNSPDNTLPGNYISKNNSEYRYRYADKPFHREVNLVSMRNGFNSQKQEV